MCYPGIHEFTRDDGSNRETTEGPGLQEKKPGKNNCGSYETDKNMYVIVMEVGVNESSKKKLVRGTWAGHGDKGGDEKLAKRADAQKVEGVEARKTEIAMGDCINSYLERVGEEWGEIRDRRNWRLLTENVVREK